MNADQSVISEPTRIIKRDRAPEPMPVPAAEGSTIDAVLHRALADQTFPVERLTQLLELKERWEAMEAKKAFVADMAEFKKNPPIFHKVKHVDYGVGKPKFDYAPIAEVVSKILPALAAHGLTHNWVPSFDDGKISVRCVLTHRLGHSESIDSPPVAPGNNPAMSQSQNYQATITFWQRMTLQSITGTAAGDMPDTDDGGADDQRDAMKIPARVDGHKPYAEWQLDMRALADEGKSKLQAAWQKSPQTYTDYAVDIDKEWWANCKKIAAAVDAKAKQS
jgi:hypothetical protein